MKRKMLISIALIMIMLLNCMMPIMVNAVTGEEIQLNSNLYKAVKKSLTIQGIEFSADDVTHKLTLSNGTKSSITRLDLNEASITDLTDLDQFTELTHLELSGNNLTQTSNLNVLNNLSKLNYLDLSTNQLENVSDIKNLITTLQEKGTIILSGQQITSIEKVFVDGEEDSDNAETATFELPSILELAGYIKSNWKSTKSKAETSNDIAPFISVDSIPMYVTPDNNKISVNISSESGKGYKGLLEVNIHIYDDATEAGSAKNPNKAAENILNGSQFKLYYVVHDKSSEAITTMDTNLYYAIKEQLTAGQTVNSQLESYPYSVDKNGDIIYQTYTYTTSGNNRTLTNTKTGTNDYIYDYKTNILYKNNSGNKGAVVNTIVEPTIVNTADGNGTITSKEGYKVAYIGQEANKTLYIQAYDDAKTFVIDDLVLTNKITSLILNNKQIRDLDGIECFIGLTSKLNVSHNYLDNLTALYYMDAQKDSWEKQIVDKYNDYLRNRSYGNLSKSVENAKKVQEDINKNSQDITNAYNQIINLLVDASKLDATKENYEDEIKNKATSIEKILDSIYGYTDEQGKYQAGYVDKIKGYTDAGKAVKGNVDDLNKEISQMYNYLAKLYVIYNNEYKLTTLLSPNVNYITYDEYEKYDKATRESADTAKALVEEEIEYLKTLEAAGGLSDLDKELLKTAFSGLKFDSEEDKTPLADYFTKYLEENALGRVKSLELLDKFREIGIYSEMANYCLIKRMNKNTPSGYCYEEEYLENRIKELETEEIPTVLEHKMLEYVKNKTKYNQLGLSEVYDKYKNTKYTYKFETTAIEVSTCKGAYDRLHNQTPIIAGTNGYTSEQLIKNAKEAAKLLDTDTTQITSITNVVNKLAGNATRVISKVDLYEVIGSTTKYTSEVNKLFLYNQMMSLSNKLLTGDVSRYVTLPRLKNLDISYNAELEDISRISELETLYELNASYCYIGDIVNIDWTAMPNLKRLSLAYNYISDISSLLDISTLKSLDLSNNLISGKLNISEQQYMKLFKRMEEFNLAGNQITDIESLLIYLDYISSGNYANYLAREDTLNINLNNQDIELVINDKISLEQYPTTIDVELPKIFTQLLAIDTERTGFGETSQKGRIEAEGKYVTLNTRTAGDKIGKVEVLPMSGNGTKVDTCVGSGTTATIYYTVEGNASNPNPPENPGNTTDPENKPVDPGNIIDPGNPDDSNTGVDTSKLGYRVGEEYLTNVAAMTPVSDFKTILLNGLQYNVVVTKDEKEVTSGNMMTGMYVKILDKDGNTVEDQNGDLLVYQVVVKGDVNGDGVANAFDSNLIKAYRVEVTRLEGAEFEAADINSDGKVDVTDSKLLLYHRAEVAGYNLNFSKK